MSHIKLKSILNEVHQEFRSPSGGKITHLFETEKGSKYLFTDNGETKRWKAPGIHAGDEGLKKWYPFSMFVDKDAFNILQMLVHYIVEGKPCTIVTNGNNAVIAVYTDNKWKSTYNDIFPTSVKLDPSKKDAQVTFRFSKEPTVGLHVIEYRKDKIGVINDFHPGHKVSKVKKVEDMDQKEWELFLKK